ncbi:MAG: hypothetical protein WC437_04615 [Patescibacteria group bacterium]
MITCVPKPIADKIKKALKGKDISISKFLDMSSEQRIKLFEGFGIRNPKEMNLLFEKKLILKNKYIGLKNFIDKITASGKYSEARKAELAQVLKEWQEQQEERIFNPKEEETFLASLVEKIVGTVVTREQAMEISRLTSLSRKILDEGYDKGTRTWKSDELKQNYGASKVVLENYISNLKVREMSLKEMLVERLGKFKETYQINKTKAVSDLIMDSLRFISDNSIAMVASFDNSFLGRQGLKTLMIKPKIWWNMTKSSFSDIYKVLGGQNAKDALWADVYSDPYYLDKSYTIAKLIPETEEQYPTTIPSKIPFLGRFFDASEQAFTGSAIRSRTALYRFWADMAKKQGVDMTEKYQIQSLGKMVGSLTAKGQWGKRGEPAIVRLFLWAPKMLKGNIDVLTAHTGQDVSPFVRKQAAYNLLKIVGSSALLMMIANALNPGSAEDDPRSSDFGKIRVGNTRFDYTGGAASLITLASRIATQSYKSTTSGDVVKYGTGYGEQTSFDALVDFLTNKSAPATRVVIDLLKGENFKRKPVTIPSALYSLATPISIQNVVDLKDEASAQAVLGVILDAIGINTGTYSTTTDWTRNTGKELTAFKEKVGEKTFKEANKKYDELFNQWHSAVKIDVRFQELTPEQRQTVVSNKKSELKEKVMKSYGFKYKKEKAVKLPKL